jgi:hypothetical protein
MAIWLDQLEHEGAAPLRQPQQDRRLLRHSLEKRQARTDDVLLVLDALPRGTGPRDAAADADAHRLLREALARTPHELHALRDGQLCVLLPGPVTNEQVKRFLMHLDRDLQPAWNRRYELVFGAARASEARLSHTSWLGLADTRFQSRADSQGLGQSLYAQARGEERRRGARR